MTEYRPRGTDVTLLVGPAARLAVRGWGCELCDRVAAGGRPRWRVIHLAAWTDIYRQFAFDDSRPDLNDADVPGDLSAGRRCARRTTSSPPSAAERPVEPRPAHGANRCPSCASSRRC